MQPTCGGWDPRGHKMLCQEKKLSTEKNKLILDYYMII
jgi:hypothetical protein